MAEEQNENNETKKKMHYYHYYYGQIFSAPYHAGNNVDS